MRKSPLPSPASFPYSPSTWQSLLRCELPSASPSPLLRPSPWRLLPSHRHDRPRLATSITTTSAAASTIIGSSQSSDSQSTSSDPQDADRTIPALPQLPFKFDTGIALFAKRAPRPFPPPFLSPPSGSFSDPLSTHDRSHDRRPKVNGERIKGWTNGDDAAFASEYFIGTNDGVGAWSARPRGHAGLWARLILHFWATAMSEDAAAASYQPDPVAYLQRAFERTKEATAGPDWQGTTTATGAQLYYQQRDDGSPAPLLYVTNLGDSQVMVVRPSSRELVFKTTEQWHWFDCPLQLGTNSPDTPVENAVVDKVDIQEGDVVLAMSDGVIDNLWSHEIVANVSDSVQKWEAGEVRSRSRQPDCVHGTGAMAYVAEELMLAAKTIALDPFAESPFMEHAIEEGLPSEGGKLDDISVVAARCMRNTSSS